MVRRLGFQVVGVENYRALRFKVHVSYSPNSSKGGHIGAWVMKEY